VGPVGQREGRRIASADGRAGDGSRGPGGGGGHGAQGRGEKVGPDSSQPRGDFPFSFFIFISISISISLFLNLLFLLNKYLSMFSWVSKIFYVRCY
jgi:hypothetical protein